MFENGPDASGRQIPYDWGEGARIIAKRTLPIFGRLKAAGLDEDYVRAWLLPDWWDDGATESRSGQATLEVYLARMIGLPVAELRSSNQLAIRPTVGVRFKKRAGCREEEVAPATAIAEQVAKALATSVNLGDPKIGNSRAADVRGRLVAQWKTVHLQALIDFAWDHGIAVAHMAELPKGSRKFDGLAMFWGSRPVIILGSGRDSPAWLAFHLAHELGHILLRHVTPETPPLSDASLEPDGEDPQEIEANKFALELLTGRDRIEASPVWGLTGEGLVSVARQFGDKNAVDPGVVALLYGWAADRMPVAQRALGLMNASTGAHEIFSNAVRARINPDLSETNQLLMRLVTES